ncbi:MAG TPA: helix-turn-helix domain-containing protein [Actinomycetes bacterium]|jgi:excisionase family DNA binding protein|nr:helix-turn-helix domain-containing protein [Actinomycetes bacterium]
MHGERSRSAAVPADREEGRAEPDRRLTVTVPEAAQLLGISRGAAYEAAHRGELPILRIGRRMVVPWPALRRLLDGTAADTNRRE